MTEPATKQTSPITLEDLMLVVQIIQTCSTRGAFRADELTSVGTVYDKILGFLNASGALQQVQPEAPAATIAATDTPMASA